MNTQEQAVISEAVMAMDALIILGEQNVPPPYSPLKERYARDRLKALLHAPADSASAQLAAMREERDGARQQVSNYDSVASARDKLQEELTDSIAKHYETHKFLQDAQAQLAEVGRLTKERDEKLWNPWHFCPECGSDQIRHEEGRHKQCAVCHQEWFSDTDYTAEVQINLGKLATLRRERDELKDRLVEAALSLGHFDLGYYSLQSKALSLVRTGRPFSGSQSAVLTSVLEELKTAAEAKSPEWPARAKQGEGQP